MPDHDPKVVSDGVINLSVDESDFNTPYFTKRAQKIEIPLVEPALSPNTSPPISIADRVAVLVLDVENNSAVCGFDIEGLPSVISQHFSNCSNNTDIAIYFASNDNQALAEYVQKFETQEINERSRISDNRFELVPKKEFLFLGLKCDALGKVTLDWMNLDVFKATDGDAASSTYIMDVTLGWQV